MDALAASLQTAADWITVHITMWVLIATGLFLTVITRGVQVRHLPDMVRQVGGSRSGAEGGISSFQAFAISLAARVGVGNVFGVAAALLMGGPGAVFWMWVVAGVGMATAFFMAPVMALVYIVLILIICLVNLDEFLRVIGRILSSAFAPEPLVGGLGGGVLAAVINGTKRGLFSNEAGQGTAPNAAATATVSHPVQQGFIQSLGVFIDTIVVCTATAFVILIAGPQTWTAEGAGPATLTTLAISHELGGWTVLPMAVLIFVLAYSSIIAAYVYSDVNMSYLTGGKRWASWAVRVVCVASATAGAVLALDVVWNAVDIAMAVMTLTNLIALLWLSRWGVGALRDYENQRARGVVEPVFHAHGNPYLPGDVPGDVWASAAFPSPVPTTED